LHPAATGGRLRPGARMLGGHSPPATAAAHLGGRQQLPELRSGAGRGDSRVGPAAQRPRRERELQQQGGRSSVAGGQAARPAGIPARGGGWLLRPRACVMVVPGGTAAVAVPVVLLVATTAVSVSTAAGLQGAAQRAATSKRLRRTAARHTAERAAGHSAGRVGGKRGSGQLTAPGGRRGWR
jgi:hypothetical protein